MEIFALLEDMRVRERREKVQINSMYGSLGTRDDDEFTDDDESIDEETSEHTLIPEMKEKEYFL